MDNEILQWAFILCTLGVLAFQDWQFKELNKRLEKLEQQNKNWK
jgi:hypothetical protein